MESGQIMEVIPKVYPRRLAKATVSKNVYSLQKIKVTSKVDIPVQNLLSRFSFFVIRKLDVSFASKYNQF